MTAKQQHPTAEDLAETTERLKAFLATYEVYRIFLQDPSFGTWAGTYHEVLSRFASLEKRVNPKRIPFGQRGHFGGSTAHWPVAVCVALSAIDEVVGALIERWDVPEICEDKGILRGSFVMKQPGTDGRETEERVDRPFQPLTMTPHEEQRLRWSLVILGEATATGEGANGAGEPSADAAPVPDERALILDERRSLTETQRNILDAALILGATCEDRRKPQAQIAERAGADWNSGTARSYFTELKRRGYLDTKGGSDGGTWLTARGVQIAEARKP